MIFTAPLPFSARLSAFAADIKLSHSIFAMPWAVFATFLAADAAHGRLPTAWQVLLIVLCMFFARTAAMAANRLIDARLDALNPRTQSRALPSGTLSFAFVAAALAICCLAFIATTSFFGILYQNWIPLIGAVPVLLLVIAYPFFKRFTRLCHYYLGAMLALAPLCAWLAIAGAFAAVPLVMAAAVLLWTAGFDILYACQDIESDRQTGVFSVPARVGVASALWIARGTHALCVAALIGVGLLSPALGAIYFSGVGLAVALLIAEHAVVKPNDLSKLNLAFFTLNGVISLVLGTLGVIDVLVR